MGAAGPPARPGPLAAAALPRLARRRVVPPGRGGDARGGPAQIGRDAHVEVDHLDGDGLTAAAAAEMASLLFGYPRGAGSAPDPQPAALCHAVIMSEE